MHSHSNIGVPATSLLSRLWDDDRAVVVSMELILIATIVVIGLIVGLATYRDSIVNELGDAGIAISALNQSYFMATDLDAEAGGQQTTRTFTFGHVDCDPANFCNQFVSVTVEVFDSRYTDRNDFCDHIIPGLEGSSIADPAGQAPACIVIDGTSQEQTQ